MLKLWLRVPKLQFQAQKDRDGGTSKLSNPTLEPSNDGSELETCRLEPYGLHPAGVELHNFQFPYPLSVLSMDSLSSWDAAFC